MKFSFQYTTVCRLKGYPNFNRLEQQFVENGGRGSTDWIHYRKRGVGG
jgi:hypothetical protein